MKNKNFRIFKLQCMKFLNLARIGQQIFINSHICLSKLLIPQFFQAHMQIFSKFQNFSVAKVQNFGNLTLQTSRFWQILSKAAASSIKFDIPFRLIDETKPRIKNFFQNALGKEFLFQIWLQKRLLLFICLLLFSIRQRR